MQAVTKESVLEIPLFPLHTVLFPGGALPLRIFEPRYLDMISDCLRTGSGFGICLISEGNETGGDAEVFEYGTLGDISYWQQLPDGLLGITVRGRQRFRLVSNEIRSNGLNVGQVELLPNDSVVSLPSRYMAFAEMVSDMMDEMGHPYTTLPKSFDDAGWVSNRLAELLPIALVQKQYFLQLDDPIERLDRLSAILAELEQD